MDGGTNQVQFVPGIAAALFEKYTFDADSCNHRYQVKFVSFCWVSLLANQKETSSCIHTFSNHCRSPRLKLVQSDLHSGGRPRFSHRLESEYAMCETG